MRHNDRGQEMPAFSPREPLLAQLNESGFEYDQNLNRALEISASKPDISPEDRGFPGLASHAIRRSNTCGSTCPPSGDEERAGVMR